MENPLAYFAGIIDGEAAIGYYTRPRMKSKAPRVAVAMVSEEVIKAIHQHFGTGHVYYRQFKTPNRKPQWVWSVEHRKARAVLVLVLPFLIARRADVEAILHEYV